MALLNEKLLNGFLNKLYPIGKTEFFLDNEDHSNYMGFTWQLDCKGRVPVGLDTSDTDFNIIGKIGGSKELQEHTHSINSYGGDTSTGTGWVAKAIDSYSAGQALNTGSTGTGNSGNLQPYKVFAIWVRIA